MKLFALLLMPFMVMSQSHEEAKKLLNQVYESTLALESQHILFTNTIEVPSNGGIKKEAQKGELFAIGEKVRVKPMPLNFFLTEVRPTSYIQMTKKLR